MLTIVAKSFGSANFPEWKSTPCW